MILTLTDDVDTLTLELEVPLTEETVEGAQDVQTLDYNIYTSFITQKRLWSHTWAFLDESVFNELKGFYDRQFTLFKYPMVSIPDLDVTDVTVRMTLNPRTVIDNCGTVDRVTISLRETRQLPESGSS